MLSDISYKKSKTHFAKLGNLLSQQMQVQPPDGEGETMPGSTEEDEKSTET